MKIVRPILIILLVAALGAGAYYGYNYYQSYRASQTPAYQTIRLQTGDLNAVVGATGTVRASQTSILVWQTSGTVLKINVGVGDQVVAGSSLAILDRTSLPQTMILAEADLVTAQRSLDNLRQSNVAKAQAFSNLVSTKKALDDAQRHRNIYNYDRGTEDQMAAARADYLLAQNQVDFFQSVYDHTSGDPAKDARKAVALSNLQASKTRRDKALENLNWYQGTPSQQDLNQADAALAVAQAAYEDANREWNRLKNGADPQDIAAAQARVTALQATLDLRELHSPIAGTITDVKIQEGDQVSPASAAFRIDDLSPMLVDVPISEVDINRVKVDQPVTLTFDAILGKTYNGRVSQVGRFGAPVQGNVSFTITVELQDADENVRPGMTAAVNVLVDQLQGVLLVPNRTVHTRNGQQTVYVFRNDLIENVVIDLGASSDTNSQVLSGDVKAGDLVVLNPPLDFSGGSLQPGR